MPGVAQRTGATIYYLEIYPRAGINDAAHEPVLALMPVPGDVDVVIASELMEAGRAIQRGLVTPDRTTLIASTNRVFSMTEKIAMADGRVDEPTSCSKPAAAAAQDHARLRHGGDRRGDRQRDQRGAVRRARRRRRAAVPAPGLRGRDRARRRRHQGEPCGVHGRLRGDDRWRGDGEDAGCDAAAADARRTGRRDSGRERRARTSRSRRSCCASREFPPAARAIVRAGVERTADYQDLGYARLYLDRLAPIAALDMDATGGCACCETARQLALGMAYEDTIRVAELKIRPSRFARVRAEVRANDGQILEIAEFMHPRTQEIADTLPAPLGRFILRTGWVRGLIDRMTRKGRVVKTTSLRGFLLLYVVAALKPLRPRSLRYGVEQQHPRGVARRRVAAHRAQELRSRRRGRGGAQPGQGLRRHARARPRAVSRR